MSTVKENNPIADAIKVITDEMKKDKSEGSYYYGWQANIACAFQDAFRKYSEDNEVEGAAMNFNIHEISNIAANNFLDLLCR